ncbi:MAG: tRNA (adenosine(37)-N6)-threonylcarbamoyltransferase complex ATPase subunit type 1 TsaE [Desulfobacteraceae bacterium]|jgi:tRNA threonylcarbamoyladenosine biosynthesis protein TsaE
MRECQPQTIITENQAQTRKLGRLIGRVLQSGLLIKLIGDLGSGKTCFVQGLAVGLEVPEEFDITSPTYTLIHEYPGRIPFLHIDLYRIHDEMDAEAIGLWDMLDPASVVAVEWADRLPDALWPSDALTVRFEVQDNDKREISLFGSGLKTANLIKEIGAAWYSEGKGPL